MKKWLLAGSLLVILIIGGYFLNKNFSLKNSLGNCVVPEYAVANPYPVEFPNGHLLTQFSVAFKEGTDVRIRNDHFVSLCGADMTEINAAVNKYNLELGEENLILEEKLTAIYEEIKDNSKVSDPNLAYVIGMRGNTDKEKIIAAITAFHDSSLVEYSLSEPGGSLPSN
jgi:hypothetical protein